MSQLSQAELEAMSPQEFRAIVRKGEWTDGSIMACQGYAQTNMAIVPKEYAYEFLLFCNRNPRPCPILDVTEPGDPRPKLMAPEADLRTDVPKYRVFKNGELIDEPTDIIKYWRDDLVGFLLGCSRTFVWALRAANISWGRYGGYRTTIPCIPAGRFHGHMVVSVRAFYNAYDAVRAVQISSRHLLMHGPPIHIGDPVAIGIENFGKPDPFLPFSQVPPVPEARKPGEILMYWGCGATVMVVAVESKIPFMITHGTSRMFVTDRVAEELAIM